MNDSSSVTPWSADDRLQITNVQCLEILLREEGFPGTRLGWIIDSRKESGHPVERPWVAIATIPIGGDSLLGYYQDPFQAVQALVKNEEKE